jgi:hypothetical protein
VADVFLLACLVGTPEENRISALDVKTDDTPES